MLPRDTIARQRGGDQFGKPHDSAPLAEVTATAEMPEHIKDMQDASYLGIYNAQDDFLRSEYTQGGIFFLSNLIGIGETAMAIESLYSLSKLSWSGGKNLIAKTLANNAAKTGAQYTKSSLQLGQQMHKAYNAGKVGKEFRLLSGKRIDYLDIQNGIIYELKPFNPRAIKAGQNQLNMYLKELQSPAMLQKYPEFRGINWKTVLDTY